MVPGAQRRSPTSCLTAQCGGEERWIREIFQETQTGATSLVSEELQLILSVGSDIYMNCGIHFFQICILIVANAAPTPALYIGCFSSGQQDYCIMRCYIWKVTQSQKFLI